MFIQIDNDIININHIIMIEYYKKLEAAAKNYYSYVMKIHLRDGLEKVVEVSYDRFIKLKKDMGCILASTDYDAVRTIKSDCSDIKFDNSLPIIKSGTVKYLN